MTTAALDAATREKLISAAVAAPSIHSTQPWRYRLDPDTVTIEVRAAPERLLPHIDAIGRGLHVSVGTAVLDRPSSAPFEARPVIGVLSTTHDTRTDWLRAGQGLEHALLVATAHHVRASLFSQAVESPDLRRALRDPRGEYGHVQMLIRFGYGPEGPATPRRLVRDCPDPGWSKT